MEQSVLTPFRLQGKPVLYNEGQLGGSSFDAKDKGRNKPPDSTGNGKCSDGVNPSLCLSGLERPPGRRHPVGQGTGGGPPSEASRE